MERLGRLEEKMDKMKDDVNEVKIDVAEMKSLIKVTHANVEEHIAGDNKIINQLTPILDQLGDMVQDHVYTKMNKQKRSERLKTASLRIGIVGGVFGIIFTVVKVSGLL